MRLLSLSVLFAATLLVPSRAVSAQAAAPASLRASSVQLASLATMRSEASPVAVEQRQPTALLVVDPYNHGTRKEGMALMLVGAAGIITGLIIDEPAVTILGAGVGGLGLYFHLR